MVQADRIYKLAFRKHFTNHEGNFPLSREIKLGDYGTMNNGYFSKIGNIMENPFDIKFNKLIDNSPSYEKFSSSGSIDIKPVAKGQRGSNGLPAIKAKIELNFHADKSIFFSSAEVRYNEIQDLYSVGQKLLEFYNQKIWKKNYHLVSKVFDGNNSVFIISGNSEASVNLEATSDKLSNLDLMDASINFNLSNESKLAYEIIVPNECQIGFGLSRIYNPIFNSATFKIKKNNSELFAYLDEDTKIDQNNLVFGDVLSETLA